MEQEFMVTVTGPSVETGWGGWGNPVSEPYVATGPDSPPARRTRGKSKKAGTLYTGA